MDSAWARSASYCCLRARPQVLFYLTEPPRLLPRAFIAAWVSGGPQLVNQASAFTGIPVLWNAPSVAGVSEAPSHFLS